MQRQVVVKELDRHGPESFELVTTREGLEFMPGDCVAISPDGGKESRPYSIASGTGEAELRFIVRTIPGGLVSSYLAQCRPGDALHVSQPFGWFRPGQHNGGAGSTFFATGAGVAPFLSYARSFPNGGQQVQCFYGVRLAGDAIGLDSLRQVGEVQLAVSRETNGAFHHRRVTDFLTSLDLGAPRHYYLCGLDAMIEDVAAWLEAHGIDFSYIHREAFFHASGAAA